MTRRQILMATIGCIDGPVTHYVEATDRGQFETAAMLTGRQPMIEWFIDQDDAEMIRESFSCREGELLVTVSLRRKPTVRDWTEKQQAEKRDERKAVG